MSAAPAVVSSSIVVAVKTITLALGGTITYFSLKAYRRSGSPALRALTIGFLLVTTGAAIGGALHQLTLLSLRDGILVESLFVMFGFMVLTYSLYAERAA